TYVIDVGVEKPRNFSLGELRLSGDVLPTGTELTIDTEVSASGIGGERTVELWVEQLDPTLPIIRDGKPVLPKAVLRESRTVLLQPGSKEQVHFSVSGTINDEPSRLLTSAVADAAKNDAARLGLNDGVHQGYVRLLGQDALL